MRYRDSSNIIKKLHEYCTYIENSDITYTIFKEFVQINYDFEPSYIQIEHIDT